MATAKEIWETLSAINVNDKLEKKGKFSYLSWSWAWSKLMEHYPEAHHEILPDIVFSDGTVEVRVSITIGEVERTCWLPVLNYQNKPIANPNSFDVNTARMRCLVKAIALFGLGTYVFSGEDLPAPPADLVDKYEDMLSLVARKQHWELRKFVDDNQPYMDNLFNMAPDGQKTKFKNDVRACYGQSNTDLKANLAALEGLVGEGAASDEITEAWSEIVGYERDVTFKALNETLRKQLEEHIGELV